MGRGGESPRWYGQGWRVSKVVWAGVDTVFLLGG